MRVRLYSHVCTMRVALRVYPARPVRSLASALRVWRAGLELDRLSSVGAGPVGSAADAADFRRPHLRHRRTALPPTPGWHRSSHSTRKALKPSLHPATPTRARTGARHAFATVQFVLLPCTDTDADGTAADADDDALGSSTAGGGATADHATRQRSDGASDGIGGAAEDASDGVVRDYGRGRGGLVRMTAAMGVKSLGSPMRAKDRGSFNIFTPPSSAPGGMFEAASAGNADFDADEPVGARPSQKGFVASPSRLGAGRSEIVRLVPAHTSLAKAREHAERFKRFRQSRVPHCPALPCTALRTMGWTALAGGA